MWELLPATSRKIHYRQSQLLLSALSSAYVLKYSIFSYQCMDPDHTARYEQSG